MGMMKRNRCLWTVSAAALGLVLTAASARAGSFDVSTERSGSVVIFPKVLWDGTRDTVIEIANTGNAMAHAHCFYINAAPLNPNLPPSATNPPLWNETDFDIWLTRQQPTHWIASAGRRTQSDPFASDGAGIDPGLVPSVPQGFKGELKCIQVGDDGSVMPANKLKGEATLRRRDGDVSSYNAIALQGNSNLSGSEIGNDLELNLTAANQGGEFSACPDKLLFNHFADGAKDPVVSQLGVCTSVCVGGPTPGVACTTNTQCTPGSGGRCLACPVSTTLTLVPCSEDLENQLPTAVTVQFRIFNEFEVPLSASTTVNCWMDAQLSQISAAFTQSGFIGSPTAFTRISPNPGSGGVLGIAEETRRNTGTGVPPNGVGVTATAAFNLQVEGNRFDAASDLDDNPIPGVTDHIVIPGE